MKQIILATGLVFSLSACNGINIGSSALPSNIDWESEPAGSIEVRGKTYEITKRTGTDSTNGEVFVVEYRTKVNGRTVTCVGSIDRCPDAITSELDGPRDEGGMY